jgi:hypothetical protein
MNKFIHGLALMALLTMLVISLAWPASSIMWLASTSGPAVLLRGYLAFLAFTLLCTNPPRHPALRLITGVTAVMLLGWASYATYTNQMQFFDGVLYISVGLLFGATAIERKPQSIMINDQEYNV